MWNHSTYDCECNKARKIDKYLDTKNCSCEKRLIRKLVLECEDEMLNTIKISLVEIKKTCKKNSCPIHKISLVIMCLLLVAVVSIGWYFFYTSDWIKK